MSRIVTATQAKAQILRLLDEVAAGDEVDITKHGRVVARLIPARGTKAWRGMFRGTACTATEDETELFTTGEVWELR